MTLEIHVLTQMEYFEFTKHSTSLGHSENDSSSLRSLSSLKRVQWRTGTVYSIGGAYMTYNSIRSHHSSLFLRLSVYFSMIFPCHCYMYNTKVTSVKKLFALFNISVKFEKYILYFYIIILKIIKNLLIPENWCTNLNLT